MKRQFVTFTNPFMSRSYGPSVPSNYTNNTTVNYSSTTADLKKEVYKISAGIPQKPKTKKAKEKKKQAPPRRTYEINNHTPDGIDLAKYSWNLPPHKFSLPVEPTVLTEGMAADSSNWDKESDTVDRRGRIYWYSRVDADVLDSASYNYSSAFNSNSKLKQDPRYGFQFLWNPTEFATSVSVNMDITPNANDAFLKVVGAFPSGESLTVKLMVDRTNDLFFLRSYFADPKELRRMNSNELSKKFVSYYYGNARFDSKSTLAKKLEDLMNYGTLSDIEYLYKAINGPDWNNPAAGRNTSDIGFLMPTLLKIEIGPSKYIGYVTKIDVAHKRFTKGMIPISSELLIQFNLMATAGIASGGKIYG